MAVFNDYIDSNIRNGRLTGGLSAQGTRVVQLVASFETVAADDAGSIYRVFKAIPSSAVPLMIGIATDGVTSMSDVDVCLYQVGAGNPEVGTEVLASTLDLSSAVTFATALSGIGNGMGNITRDNYGKSLWELAGETITSKKSHYDIGLKSVADLAEADRIVVIAKFAFP